MPDDKPRFTMATTFSGPTCKAGTFDLRIAGPLNIKTLDAVIKNIQLYREFIFEEEQRQADLQKSDTSE